MGCSNRLSEFDMDSGSFPMERSLRDPCAVCVIFIISKFLLFVSDRPESEEKDPEIDVSACIYYTHSRLPASFFEYFIEKPALFHIVKMIQRPAASAEVQPGKKCTCNILFGIFYALLQGISKSKITGNRRRQRTAGTMCIFIVYSL